MSFETLITIVDLWMSFKTRERMFQNLSRAKSDMMPLEFPCINCARFHPLQSIDLNGSWLMYISQIPQSTQKYSMDDFMSPNWLEPNSNRLTQSVKFSSRLVTLLYATLDPSVEWYHQSNASVNSKIFYAQVLHISQLTNMAVDWWHTCWMS